MEDHIKTTHPSSAAPAAPPVKRQIMLYCDICEFMTRDKVAFQVHGMRHQEKSVYKCKRCSFSVPHPKVLEHHMTHHHSKRKRVINQVRFIILLYSLILKRFNYLFLFRRKRNMQLFRIWRTKSGTTRPVVDECGTSSANIVPTKLLFASISSSI